jgi:hypothetical protein
MKLLTKVVCTAVGAGLVLSSPASATDVRFQVSAYVATSCEMNFSADVRATSDTSFSLGTLNQFCNVPFQMSLHHSTALTDAVLNYRGKHVVLNAGSAMLEQNGRPVNGSTLLSAHGIDSAQASELASTMYVVVTPSSF